MTNRIRQRLPEHERQEQILQAATRVGAEQGLMKLTLRNVAEEAGVSHALVVHHFRNKQGMQRALLRFITAALLNLPEIPDIEAPVPERLLLLVKRQLEQLRDKSDLVGLLLEFRVLTRSQPALREEVRRNMEMIFEIYEPLSVALVAEYPERFAGATGRSLSRTIANTLIGYEISLLIHPGSTREADVIETLAVLLGGEHDALAATLS